VAKFVSSDIALVWFPDDDHLRIEICRDIQCDITIEIPEEQYYAFCWYSVVNWVSTVHRKNNVKFTMAVLWQALRIW
jgi:uncharacterized radical SAM superfamily Fe-S cluster-containing enzyme